MKNIGHELMSPAKTEKKLTYSIRTIEFNKKNQEESTIMKVQQNRRMEFGNNKLHSNKLKTLSTKKELPECRRLENG